jgi:hypothetical protein
MNQKSSLREVLQFVSRVLTGNKGWSNHLAAGEIFRGSSIGGAVLGQP